VTAARGVLAVNDAAERLIEGLALALRYPDARLVFSGGSGALFPDGSLERDVDERFMTLMAADGVRVVYEDRSRNTWENARYTRELVEPTGGEVWLLVTSAAHMPRSVGIFRRIGWPVVPWPVDYRTSGGVTLMGLAAGDRLVQLDEATREWLALAAYHLMDRTDALFPAPGSGPAGRVMALHWQPRTCQAAPRPPCFMHIRTGRKRHGHQATHDPLRHGCGCGRAIGRRYRRGAGPFLHPHHRHHRRHLLPGGRGHRDPGQGPADGFRGNRHVGDQLRRLRREHRPDARRPGAVRHPPGPLRPLRRAGHRHARGRGAAGMAALDLDALAECRAFHPRQRPRRYRHDRRPRQCSPASPSRSAPAIPAPRARGARSWPGSASIPRAWTSSTRATGPRPRPCRTTPSSAPTCRAACRCRA
jgi:hypothetical protein